jgi:predicted RNA-binding Zn ribbon-like protein
MSRPHPRLCVDFVNTVEWRTDPERIEEKLASFDDLVHWAAKHEVISDAVARKLLRTGHERSRLAGQVLDRAIQLRDAIYRVLSATAATQKPAPDRLDVVAREARHFSAHIHLKYGEDRVEWEWNGDEDDLDRVLWPVVHSTIELLRSDLLSRIRECEGPGCGWIILDQTKNRSRRWCEMKTCGNRAKVKRFYERHKQESGRR